MVTSKHWRTPLRSWEQFNGVRRYLNTTSPDPHGEIFAIQSSLKSKGAADVFLACGIPASISRDASEAVAKLELEESVAVEKAETDALDEWVAMNIVGFWIEVNRLYDVCKQQHKEMYRRQGEGFPPGQAYSMPGKTKETGHKYVLDVLKWVSEELDNEQVFPGFGSRKFFRKNFDTAVSSIYKRLARIYLIMYTRCLNSIIEAEVVPYLNNCFKRFYYFVTRYDLVAGKVFNPLNGGPVKSTLNFLDLQLAFEKDEVESISTLEDYGFRGEMAALLKIHSERKYQLKPGYIKLSSHRSGLAEDEPLHERKNSSGVKNELRLIDKANELDAVESAETEEEREIRRAAERSHSWTKYETSDDAAGLFQMAKHLHVLTGGQSVLTNNLYGEVEVPQWLEDQALEYTLESPEAPPKVEETAEAKRKALDDWIAENCVGCLIQLKALYALFEANHKSLPRRASVPTGSESWLTEKKVKSGHEYVKEVFASIEQQIQDPTVFPKQYPDEFPSNFKTKMREAYTQMNRVYAIMYHIYTNLNDRISEESPDKITLGEVKHRKVDAALHASFKRFFYFSKRYELIHGEEFKHFNITNKIDGAWKVKETEKQYLIDQKESLEANPKEEELFASAIIIT